MTHHAVLSDDEFLDSRRFLVAAKRLANDLAYGTDPSQFLGSGTEYVQSRLYQSGDPIRSLDWRVMARTGKPFVKQFEATKALPCYLLIDTSASMTVSSLPRSKYGHAVIIATGLALACLDRVSPVGMIAVGSRDLRIRPSLSRDQILTWSHELKKYRFDESTSLTRRITELAPMLVSRAMVIVLSDLHDPGCVGAIRLLAQNHDVCVLQFRDPAEVGQQGTGFIRAREVETGHLYMAKGTQELVKQSAIEQSMKRGGIDHMLIDTGKPYERNLRHFFASRSILGKAQR
ncbi:DUF58 domain-containing protein [Bremerella cremea]|uniref:DUF58 domain-containing protein n=1 Tax=Bremerella cremea TaxID=1031537 RepID=UPI0031EF1144